MGSSHVTEDDVFMEGCMRGQITSITLWAASAHLIGWAWTQAIIAHVVGQLISFVAEENC